MASCQMPQKNEFTVGYGSQSQAKKIFHNPNTFIAPSQRIKVQLGCCRHRYKYALNLVLCFHGLRHDGIQQDHIQLLQQDRARHLGWYGKWWSRGGDNEKQGWGLVKRVIRLRDRTVNYAPTTNSIQYTTTMADGALAALSFWLSNKPHSLAISTSRVHL